MNFFRFPSIFRIFFIIGFLLLGSTVLHKLVVQNPKIYSIIITVVMLVVCIVAAIWAGINPKSSGIIWSDLVRNRAVFNSYSASTFEQHLFIQSIFQIAILVLLLLILVFAKGRTLGTFILLLCSLDLFISVQLNAYGTIINHTYLKPSVESISTFPTGFPLQSNRVAVRENKDDKFLYLLQPVSGNVTLFPKLIGKSGDNPFLLRSFIKLRSSSICDSVWANPPFYFANKMNNPLDTVSLNSRNNVLTDVKTYNRMDNKFEPPVIEDSIQCVGFEPNTITLNSEAKGDRLLVLQQNIANGWVARIDDLETEIFKVNHTYMGVLVPKGSHEVTFKFSPKGLLMMLCITSISIIISLAIACSTTKRNIVPKGT